MSPNVDGYPPQRMEGTQEIQSLSGGVAEDGPTLADDDEGPLVRVVRIDIADGRAGEFHRKFSIAAWKIVTCDRAMLEPHGTIIRNFKSFVFILSLYYYLLILQTHSRSGLNISGCKYVNLEFVPKCGIWFSSLLPKWELILTGISPGRN